MQCVDDEDKSQGKISKTNPEVTRVSLCVHCVCVRVRACTQVYLIHSVVGLTVP
jgi:hypothetical protein